MNGEFVHYIRTNEITFKHARGMRDIIGKEFHAYHEIFLFLEGNAEFTSDKLKQKLIPGTLVIIPRGCFHQFTCENDAQYRRCVFNFSNVGELGGLIEQKLCSIYTVAASEALLGLFRELFVAAEKAPDSPESKTLVKALLAWLLCALKPQSAVAAEALHPPVIQAVDFIHEHICQPIRVSDIAEHLHISPSYLMRIFKKALHMSVYHYITEKRIALAAMQIAEGTPPTKAAIAVGFGDYSGFYKQYKRVFGVAPSEK